MQSTVAWLSCHFLPSFLFLRFQGTDKVNVFDGCSDVSISYRINARLSHVFISAQDLIIHHADFLESHVQLMFKNKLKEKKFQDWTMKINSYSLHPLVMKQTKL